MKTITLIPAFIFLVISLSCGSYESAANSSKSSSSNPSSGVYDINPSGDLHGAGASELQPVAQEVSVAQAENLQNTQEISLEQTSQNAADRKILRNAEMNLESAAPESAAQKITALVEGVGGFVVESQQSSSDVKLAGHDVVTMTIRVPAAKFGQTLDEIRKTADRIIIESVKGQDVTEEFIDIEARLKAKKSLEAQFMEIMKRADTVEQVMGVQRQISEVRSEIEKIEGRKRFLENQTSLSTIKIRLQTPAAFAASSTGFSYRLSESFNSGFDVALNFILGFVTFIVSILPIVAFIGLPGYLVIRYVWKRQQRPRSVRDIAKEELAG